MWIFSLPVTAITSLGFFGTSGTLVMCLPYVRGALALQAVASAAALFFVTAGVSVVTHLIMGRAWVVDSPWKNALVLADKVLANSTAAACVAGALLSENRDHVCWAISLAFSVATFYWYHWAYPPHWQDWVYHHAKFHYLVQVGVYFLALHFVIDEVLEHAALKEWGADRIAV